MHLGNGAISPECAALTLTAAAAGLGVASYFAGREPLSRQKLALAVGLGGLVFAAQAVNVPLLPGSSAHLVGGVLLAWAIGPGLGALTIAIVLTIQSLALGDGGLLALGANILNMGLMPAGLVAVGCMSAAKCTRLGTPIPRVLRKASYTLQGRSMALNAALSAAAVPLAAGMILAETAFFRSPEQLAGFSSFASQMLIAHLAIGLAEGAATLGLMLVLHQLAVKSSDRTWRPAAASMLFALVLTAVVFPWSSALPDGYEAAADRSGLSSFLLEDPQSLQQSIVSALQSVIVSEQALVIAAMLLTALATGMTATLVSRRELSAVKVRRR